MLVSDHLLTWSDENIEADHSRLAKAPPSAPCANCPRSKLSFVVPSWSATNAVASPVANAPTAPVMAPSTISR